MRHVNTIKALFGLASFVTGVLKAQAQTPVPPVGSARTVQIKTKLLRIAAIEHRYAAPADCEAAAKVYADSHGTTIARAQISRPTEPLVYSFCEDCKPINVNSKEIRFTVVAVSPLLPSGSTIKYWEVEKTIPLNGIAIRRAYKELVKKYNAGGILAPLKDEIETNDNNTWRGIVGPATGVKLLKSGQQTREAEEPFGIIINPPFP